VNALLENGKNNMLYELEIISDVHKFSKNGKQTLIKRNDKIKRLFDLNEVTVEEFLDPKTGKHISKYSLVIYKDATFKVNKPYEVLKSIVQNKSIPVLGLASKSKSYK
jgi:hypothetical protein